GEMTQRFIEFVMMQAQQAAMFLGRIPNPQTGKPEVNLEIARMFIDQLEMIHEKTRGNLTSEESEILARVLSDLQLAFVQASGPGAETASAPSVADVTDHEESAAPASETPAAPPVAAEPAPGIDPESGNRKKFTKSYGA
ncbi:MAG: DUF1844 domain-containing protein, partial [Terrimicrobiaceae bacterium]